jgi:hypothetical protein
VVDGKTLVGLVGTKANSDPPSFDAINRRISALMEGTDEPIFWTIDLSSAYQTHPALRPEQHKPEDGEYTVIATLIEGVEYVFTTMIFGIPDAPHHFNNCLDAVFKQNGLSNSSLPYVDDILTVSKDIRSGGESVVKLIDTLGDNGYRVNFLKSRFAMDGVSFLGRTLDKHGSRADNLKLKELINIKRITKPKKLQEFIGKINWLQQHVNIPINIMISLRIFSQLEKFSQADTEDLKTLIDQCKPFLENPIALHYPVMNARFHIHTDASVEGMGGILFQIINNAVHIVATFQNTFTTSQKAWTIYRKEIYTVLKALTKWRPFFGENQVSIKCDNLAAVNAIINNKPSDDHFITIWIGLIREFTFDIEHISGKSNFIPDNLSRASPNNQDISNIDPMTNNTKVIEPQSPNSLHKQTPVNHKWYFPNDPTSENIAHLSRTSRYLNFTDPTMPTVHPSLNELELLMSHIERTNTKPIKPQLFNTPLDLIRQTATKPQYNKSALKKLKKSCQSRILTVLNFPTMKSRPTTPPPQTRDSLSE